MKGVALGLYSEDPDWSYTGLIAELKSVGASHVAVVVPYYLENDTASKIYAHPRFTVPMTTVGRKMTAATWVPTDMT